MFYFLYKLLFNAYYAKRKILRTNLREKPGKDPPS
jgi:hypothetical protein